MAMRTGRGGKRDLRRAVSLSNLKGRHRIFKKWRRWNWQWGVDAASAQEAVRRGLSDRRPP